MQGPMTVLIRNLLAAASTRLSDLVTMTVFLIGAPLPPRG